MSCKNTMHDGRFTTSYEPNCQMNEYMKNKYAPGASSEYRHFLQHNACLIMEKQRERTAYENTTGCKCNYDHPPHNKELAYKYHWNPSSSWLHNRFIDFNKPIPGPASNNSKCCGGWSKFC